MAGTKANRPRVGEDSSRSVPWPERQAKVEAVLRKFAAAEQASANVIPYSSLIPDISRLIVWEARGDIPTVSRLKVVRTKRIKLRKVAEALLADLSNPSLSVLLPLDERLAIIQLAYIDTDLKGHRGAPRKDAAGRVARLLAQHFEGLTGSPPTRITQLQDGIAQRSSGQFVKFLAEVYLALWIDASVENQAKSAIKAMEINRPKN